MKCIKLVQWNRTTTTTYARHNRKDIMQIRKRNVVAISSSPRNEKRFFQPRDFSLLTNGFWLSWSSAARNRRELGCWRSEKFRVHFVPCKNKTWYGNPVRSENNLICTFIFGQQQIRTRHSQIFCDIYNDKGKAGPLSLFCLNPGSHLSANLTLFSATRSIDKIWLQL